jgi:hypothetical protein
MYAQIPGQNTKQICGSTQRKKEKVLVPPKDMIYHCKCNRGMFDIHVRIDIRTTKIKNNM